MNWSTPGIDAVIVGGVGLLIGCVVQFRKRIAGWLGFQPRAGNATKPAVLAALATLRDEAILLQSDGMMAGVNKTASEYFQIRPTPPGPGGAP